MNTLFSLLYDLLSLCYLVLSLKLKTQNYIYYNKSYYLIFNQKMKKRKYQMLIILTKNDGNLTLLIKYIILFHFLFFLHILIYFFGHIYFYIQNKQKYFQYNIFYINKTMIIPL